MSPDDIKPGTPGWPKRLGQMWLRDRARDLRKNAARAERAYTTGTPLGTTARYVSEQYLRAAELLEAAAVAMEQAPHG